MTHFLHHLPWRCPSCPRSTCLVCMESMGGPQRAPEISLGPGISEDVAPTLAASPASRLAHLGCSARCALVAEDRRLFWGPKMHQLSPVDALFSNSQGMDLDGFSWYVLVRGINHQWHRFPAFFVVTSGMEGQVL